MIGINTFRIGEAYYAINIEEAIRILNLHDVPYTMAGDVGTGESEDTEEVSGEAEEPDITEEPEASVSEDEEDLTADEMLLLAACFIIIAAIVAVILALKKKSRPAPPQGFPATTPAIPVNPPMPTPLPESPADSGYRLQGVSGVLGGRRFMIRKDGPLTLGRNPDVCNVVYPASTAGVSGKHCQVWCEHGTVYMKDVGSNHGTYNASGEKLATGQAVKLNPGETFSLGSRNETMILVQKGGN